MDWHELAGIVGTGGIDEYAGIDGADRAEYRLRSWHPSPDYFRDDGGDGPCNNNHDWPFTPALLA